MNVYPHQYPDANNCRIEEPLTMDQVYNKVQKHLSARKTMGSDQEASGTSTKCYRCDRGGHQPDICWTMKNFCPYCGLKGHIARKCKVTQRQKQTGSGKKEYHNSTNAAEDYNCGPTPKLYLWLVANNKRFNIRALPGTESTTTIIRESIAKAHRLPVEAARNASIVNTSGKKVKRISQVALTINHRGRIIQAHALVAEKLCHKMIISWRDCIRLEVIPKTFSIPPEPGHVNNIQNEADTIKETITNKSSETTSPTRKSSRSQPR